MRTALLIALPLLTATVPATAAPAKVIEAHLSNFRIAPDVIHLIHGQAYVLKIVNDAGGGHNFIAKQFFKAAGVDARTRATLARGGVEVPSGGAVELRFVAPAAGHYGVKCTHFLHAGFGMKGEIVVS